MLALPLRFNNAYVQGDQKFRKYLGSKVGCVFPMIIWSEFRVGQYDGHREAAPLFMRSNKLN